MKLFIDANILVAVLNKEYPLFSSAAKVLSLADRNFDISTSPVCISIAFYFSTKKSGDVLAKKKIGTLLNHLSLTTVDEHCTRLAVDNQQINDLEDGIQYYSAIESGCDFIITENLDDFYFSKIPVMTAKGFLRDILKVH